MWSVRRLTKMIKNHTFLYTSATLLLLLRQTHKLLSCLLCLLLLQEVHVLFWHYRCAVVAVVCAKSGCTRHKCAAHTQRLCTFLSTSLHRIIHIDSHRWIYILATHTIPPIFSFSQSHSSVGRSVGCRWLFLLTLHDNIIRRTTQTHSNTRSRVGIIVIVVVLHTIVALSHTPHMPFFGVVPANNTERAVSIHNKKNNNKTDMKESHKVECGDTHSTQAELLSFSPDSNLWTTHVCTIPDWFSWNRFFSQSVYDGEVKCDEIQAKLGLRLCGIEVWIDGWIDGRVDGWVNGIGCVLFGWLTGLCFICDHERGWNGLFFCCLFVLHAPW